VKAKKHTATNATLAVTELEAKVPDFGPDWRAAAEAGVDMWLLLENLRLSHWERLCENQRALTLVRMLEQAKPVTDG
jgi:hypothetical protein